jgi:hypothetical protein
MMYVEDTFSELWSRFVRDDTNSAVMIARNMERIKQFFLAFCVFESILCIIEQLNK